MRPNQSHICVLPQDILTKERHGCRQPIGKMTATSPVKRCLNLGSNNYLGFAVNGGADELVFSTLRHYGIAACSPRTEVGTTKLHLELER